eukprot:TRINITY_DN27981_c0_g1_i1.p1 TRINITY_DN27981_c0_g1~~TRINITY_DN27981_c0_g1_i1.p1  ORF type:complete len:195 (-),score=35.44 TRINITY_DN27981_c0_g1_i1:53-637(-)
MASELNDTGVVHLPKWMVPPMGPLGSKELVLAVTALRIASKAYGTGGSAILGSGPGALHATLASLSEVGASVYCDSSSVVASCAECAQRFLGMLVDSGAPGWTFPKRPEGSARHPTSIRLVESLSGPESQTQLEAADALCCIFGLGTEDGATVCKVANSGKHVSLAAGDIILTCQRVSAAADSGAVKLRSDSSI